MDNYKYELDFTIQLGDISDTNCLTNKAILRYMQEAGAAHSDSVGHGLNNESKDALAWLLLRLEFKSIFQAKMESKITYENLV
ncbi:MAG: hypothetical protein IKT41_02690 [Clostridia bacterium]|nr:hypothetical protein [Clostridia bacterium]